MKHRTIIGCSLAAVCLVSGVAWADGPQRCLAESHDANWQSRATALFTATGAPQGLAIRVEVRAAATDLKLAKYGYNYDTSRARYPALGRLRITTVQPVGQPPLTAVEIAAPEVFSMLDAVAAGAGESGGGSKVSLRVIADGKPVFNAAASLAKRPADLDSSVANIELVTVGDGKTANAEAQALADALTNAQSVRIESLIDGQVAGVFEAPAQSLKTALDARDGLMEKIDAAHAARTCTNL